MYQHKQQAVQDRPWKLLLCPRWKFVQIYLNGKTTLLFNEDGIHHSCCRLHCYRLPFTDHYRVETCCPLDTLIIVLSIPSTSPRPRPRFRQRSGFRWPNQRPKASPSSTHKILRKSLYGHPDSKKTAPAFCQAGIGLPTSQCHHASSQNSHMPNRSSLQDNAAASQPYSTTYGAPNKIIK